MPEEEVIKQEEECIGDIKIFNEECDRKKRSIDNLNIDILSIKDVQKDLGEKLKAYRGKVPDLEKRRVELEKYSNKRTPVIMAAIQSQKAELDQKIKPYKDKINDIEKEIPLLEKARTEALKQIQNSVIEFYGKNDAYEDKKDYITKLIKLQEDNLDKLGAWRAEIEKAYNDDNPTMYGLILEFNRVLNETNLKKADELESDLYDSWKIANDATKDYLEKSEKWEIARNKIKDKIEYLEKLKEKLKEDIINRTSEGGQQGIAENTEISPGESSNETLKSQKES